MAIKHHGKSPENKNQKTDRQDREIKAEQAVGDWASDIQNTPVNPPKNEGGKK